MSYMHSFSSNLRLQWNEIWSRLRDLLVLHVRAIKVTIFWLDTKLIEFI